jgi:SET family sugar efflux transporter-like MFS transporter
VPALAFVLMQTSTTLSGSALPLYISDDLHGKVSDAGMVFGLCAGLEIPLMLAFGVAATRWPLRRLLLLGGAAGVAYSALVAVASDTWQVAALQLLNATFISIVTGLGI